MKFRDIASLSLGYPIFHLSSYIAGEPSLQPRFISWTSDVSVRFSCVTMFTLGDNVMSEATLICSLIMGSVFHRLHTPASRRSAQYVTDVCMYICALHSSISWSLSLLPNRNVSVSETGVQLKEEVLFMPGISNYGPPADFFLWPSSTRTK